MHAGQACSGPALMPSLRAMKVSFVCFCITILAVGSSVPVLGQTQSPSVAATDAAPLEALTRKIDEQNMKIDALSQQILKLEQQISSIRPGVMIGESTPAPSTIPVAAPAGPATDGSAHVVAKGETLTSIAKAHKVGVQDLQKFNHIENDRSLQIGQTIMIPIATGSSPAPSASFSASPNE